MFVRLCRNGRPVATVPAEQVRVVPNDKRYNFGARIIIRSEYVTRRYGFTQGVNGWLLLAYHTTSGQWRLSRWADYTMASLAGATFDSVEVL